MESSRSANRRKHSLEMSILRPDRDATWDRNAGLSSPPCGEFPDEPRDGAAKGVDVLSSYVGNVSLKPVVFPIEDDAHLGSLLTVPISARFKEQAEFEGHVEAVEFRPRYIMHAEPALAYDAADFLAIRILPWIEVRAG